MLTRSLGIQGDEVRQAFSRQLTSGNGLLSVRPESEKTVMSPEEELFEILLDFIIVSANLAKKINHSLKQK